MKKLLAARGFFTASEATALELILTAASLLMPEAAASQAVDGPQDAPTVQAPAPAPVFPPIASVPDLRAAIKRVLPAHVRVNVSLRMTAEDPAQPEDGEHPIEVVSGILFDSSGFIVTVAEPLSRAEFVCVDTQSGNPSAATVVGYDLMTNIGVVKIDPLKLKLPEFTSSLDLEVGAPLFSIGNPYNLGPAASLGYVAAIDREVKIGDNDWRHVLQVSMPVNEGDQGGPVADENGHVVAMLMTALRQDPARGMTAAPQGVSFAVPMERALPTARAIKKLWEANLLAADATAHKHDRPWLGVRGKDIEDPILRRHLRLEPGIGVLIELVFRNSPAEAAGLAADDVVVSFDGTPVKGADDLSERIVGSKLGATVTIEFIRDGVKQSVTLALGSF